MTEHFSRISFILVLLALSASMTHAQVNYQTVVPLIDEQTIAIIAIDLSRFDVPEALHAVCDVLPQGGIGQKIADETLRMEQPMQVLQEAGASVLVVFSLTDLPRPGPFIVVSLKPGTNRQDVLKALSDVGLDPHNMGEDLLFFGPETTLQRIKSAVPAARPEFARAFAAVGDVPMCVVVAPSADQRRVLKDMLPQLPDQLGGGSGQAIASTEWLSMVITPPQKLSLSITAQTTSADAARSLKSTLTSLLVSVGQLETLREALPKVDTLAAAVIPTVDGDRLRIHISEEAGNLKTVLAAISAPLGQAQEHASRARCVNNLKQLALAMHAYHDQHSRFPAAANQDERGNNLLSWRVHLLPYLDQKDLYDQFHLDEPWDSEHNMKLIARMPSVFACPSVKPSEGMTTYLGPTGDNALFKTAQGLRIRDIRDGTSNTIMIVDASPEQAVTWTKPEDFLVDPRQPLKGLGGQHGETFVSAFADGSVRHVPADINASTLRLLLDPADGNVIPQF